MKWQLLLVLLLGSLTQCKKAVEVDKPDSAAMVAGSYKLIKALGYYNDITDQYKASLIVHRVNSNTVKADYELMMAAPYSETWTVVPIAKDTFELGGGLKYRSGQIAMTFADGTLQLVFKKIP